MHLIRVLIFTSLCLPSFGFGQTDRFQELFIWKMSEALKLDAQKEEAFNKAVRELNQKKATALNELDQILVQMKSAKTEAKAKDLVDKYKKALVAYHQVSQNEVSEMSRIFNYNELAQYLSIKMEIVKRLQEKIFESGKDEKTKIENRKPKIILDE